MSKQGILQLFRPAHKVPQTIWSSDRPLNVRPKFGQIVDEIKFKRLEIAPTINNKPAKIDIGKTGINFSIKLDSEAINDKAKTTTDLEPLLDGLTTTGKHLAYFSYAETSDDTAPVATSFTYDPIKKAGARFYDLDGDGTSENLHSTISDISDD